MLSYDTRHEKEPVAVCAVEFDVDTVCGEAPANYPEIAEYLARLGIDSISVNPSCVLRTLQAVAEAESTTRVALVAT